MHFQKTKTFFIISFHLILLSLYGCHILRKSTDHHPNTKRIKCAVSFDPSTIDPAIGNDPLTGSYVMNQIYEGLVYYNEQNQLKPGLAESWNISKDYKKVTFYLRKNILFQNNKPVYARHFKSSIERSCHPSICSPTAPNYLSNIKGAKDYMKGKAEHISGIYLSDPYTIQVEFEKYDPLLLHKFVYPCSRIIDTESIHNSRTSIDRLDDAIGTGPFKISSYTPGISFTLERFNHYWKGKAKTKTIEVCIMNDPETIFANIDKGNIDFAEISSSSMVSILDHKKLNNQFVLSNMAGITFLNLNKKLFPPFRNKKVRQAFMYAIDKDKIQRMLANAPVMMASTLIPEYFPGHQKKQFQYQYNPQKAKALLKQSGLKPKDFDGLQIYYYTANPLPRRMAENIIAEINHTLELNIKGIGLDFHAFLMKKRSTGFPMSINLWVADYNDPATFLNELFYSKSDQNDTGYKNNKFDQQVLLAGSYIKQEDRFKNFAIAENILLEDACILPLTYFQTAMIYSSPLKGFKNNFFHTMSFHELESVSSNKK